MRRYRTHPPLAPESDRAWVHSAFGLVEALFFGPTDTMTFSVAGVLYHERTLRSRVPDVTRPMLKQAVRGLLTEDTALRHRVYRRLLYTYSRLGKLQGDTECDVE